MYVCMYASNFLLLRSTLPDPQGTGQVLTNPTIEVGKEVPRHSQCGLMLGFPSTYVQVKDRPLECGPATKDPCEIPDTPSPKSQKPAGGPWPWPEQSLERIPIIQWRPWNQAVFRWTKNRSARRKNHRISQGDDLKPHPTIIDRAESRWPESQRRRGVSDQINQRLVSLLYKRTRESRGTPG